MNQESLESIIERFQRDRQVIRDRMEERNQLFEKANQNYKSNLQRELETIKLTNKQAESRDQEFRQYIVQLFKQYDEGNQQMKLTIQQTIQEKINYNDYLIRNYPLDSMKEKKDLQEENVMLRNQLEFKQFIQQTTTLSHLYIPLIEIQKKDQEEQLTLDRYLGEHIETNVQQKQYPPIQSQSTVAQIISKPKIQEQNQTTQVKLLSTPSKKMEKDFLQEFMVPLAGRQQ
ncbi:unnamed protein product (macronuclear) [Paramecium tetraurelia]|uniref:Uncharacterized protein n=1 Tax=Paramecium tetraurelia TaxID=5888 RepID=A0CZX4_PARTE|nr:uncharacterized protein GSPATT00011914001 [Paramecium tetraurelia]CAK76341.1 unnamed protein product [Paramecium tetraurelia]|eukprot:XP_001443738.1 hypothetical protein (macronuclear) [Paramecium tetraurelia strain d4-2]